MLCQCYVVIIIILQKRSRRNFRQPFEEDCCLGGDTGVTEKPIVVCLDQERFSGRRLAAPGASSSVPGRREALAGHQPKDSVRCLVTRSWSRAPLSPLRSWELSGKRGFHHLYTS